MDEVRILINVETLRKQKGISQSKLAQEIGMSQSAFSNFVRGRRKLTFRTLEKIAEVFDMEMIDIITFPEIYKPVGKD